ncbi:MAG TPA: polynucleotide kinase-phosphatase [Ktedonobacterales bacterium]|nr:polynucleotide kinase-phosphatase [Ktedonobacterales bacterium]
MSEETSEEAEKPESETEPVSGSERVISVPQLCLIALIGPTSSGKSTFAARHFAPTEVLSSDQYRAMVGDDPNDQSVTGAAFEALHYVAGQRLKLGKLVVVDATSVKPQDRVSIVRLAREHDVFPIAIVFDLNERILRERNQARPDRRLSERVIQRHMQDLRRGLKGLAREGFRQVTVIRSPEAADAIRISRERMWSDKRDERGPFDVIGDVHGCYDELIELLALLGYQRDAETGMRHPDGRKAVFVGDLVDRGPGVVETVTLVRRMVEGGQAFCAPGNHDVKLGRKLAGRNVQIAHGLAESLAQIEALPAEERDAWTRDYRAFVDGLVSHYILDGGALVVAHAGMKEAYQGRSSGRVRDFALYGETTGETDEFGLPIRANWAADYRGRASVVYGHTPTPEAAWLNSTINIDTGCVFGGKLTALRWPERELVSVPARRQWAEPMRPLAGAAAPADAGRADVDTLLRIEDALGKQIITTRLAGSVIIEADRAAAALEVMSRFATDPRWIIYLPPTMSPSETSKRAEWLEYPSEAFAYYRAQGAPRVVCEQKHMGSRAALILCRDSAAASKRFGVPEDSAPGACYTRTGRRFFEDDALDRALITRLSAALAASGFWERLETDWVCLDAEVMPWSAKALGLLREQYAPVAAAGGASLPAALEVVSSGQARGLDLGALAERVEERRANITRYAEAYGRYCWDVSDLDGLRIAPFHLLATEGHVHVDRDHLWHMTELAKLAEADPIFMATEHRVVNVLDPEECAAAEAWWEGLTASGAEGMVVKPLEYLTRGPRGLAQPALKCRGREYLRIIYGPDYDAPENIQRLRARGLATKRALAIRELSLGVEALERFTRREPLWRTHQAVFGVLALESEPVDPRL